MKMMGEDYGNGGKDDGGSFLVKRNDNGNNVPLPNITPINHLRNIIQPPMVSKSLMDTIMNNPQFRNEKILTTQDVLNVFSMANANTARHDSSINIPLPKFGINDKNEKVEKEFKNVFNGEYFADPLDNTMPINVLLDLFREFVEKHGLTAKSSEALLRKILRGESRDWLINQTRVLGNSLTNQWFVIQSAMRDKMSPSDADDKVKEIIDNPPEKKTVGHLLFEIMRLTLLANSNLRLPERLQTSLMQSRSNIRKFLDKNYNYSTVQNIFRIFDDAMDSGKIPLEDSVNHLIQIATKETAYQETKKKRKEC